MNVDKKRQGYVFINRSLQDHYLWTAEPFTKGQAWVDLILYANWKDTQVLDRGEVLEIRRGQFYASDEHWEKRWQWSRNKVRNYFKLLENEGMIKKAGSRRRTMITILNYDVYQPFINEEGTTEGITESTTEGTRESISKSTTGSTSEGTSKGTQHKNIKNGNNRKKGKSNDESISDKENDPADCAREDLSEICGKLGWRLPVNENELYEYWLTSTFGEGKYDEFAREEVKRLHEEYGEENLLDALEKTEGRPGATIAYTAQILANNAKQAARV